MGRSQDDIQFTKTRKVGKIKWNETRHSVTFFNFFFSMIWVGGWHLHHRWENYVLLWIYPYKFPFNFCMETNLIWLCIVLHTLQRNWWRRLQVHTRTQASSPPLGCVDPRAAARPRAPSARPPVVRPTAHPPPRPAWAALGPALADRPGTGPAAKNWPLSSAGWKPRTCGTNSTNLGPKWSSPNQEGN